MRTTMRTVLILIVTILTITACQKQPKAGFTIDRKTIFPGETIKFTSTSTDAYAYLWTTNGGTNYYSRDLSLVASNTIGDRNITLKVLSKNGKKESEFTDTYSVVDFYNKLFVGNYNGNSSNKFYDFPVTVVTNNNDKITINDPITTIYLDFIITSQSSTVGTLVPKIVYFGTSNANFKSGTITRSNNLLIISGTYDYTDPAAPQTNSTNATFTDVISK